MRIRLFSFVSAAKGNEEKSSLIDATVNGFETFETILERLRQAIIGLDGILHRALSVGQGAIS